MAQSNCSLPVRQDSDERRQAASRQNPSMFHSASAPQRLRNEAESWVEISSQPSSSSLSSIGDEIITTGLRVQRGAQRRRRRPQFAQQNSAPVQLSGTSSQEEYDETESEEDQVMTSSTEHIQNPAFASSLPQPAQPYESDSDDDDENATALGRVRDEPLFTPQPNAFSHPPASQLHRRQSTSEAYSSRPPLAAHSRSYSNRSRSHNPYNAVSPSYRADNDAALRASLTTLLSCAAAARGLPKQTQESYQNPHSARNEPTGLRLVPESEVMGTAPTPDPRSKTPTTRSVSTHSVANSETETSKRKAASKASTSARASKKKRVTTSQDSLISPTLLTWLMSAGVVVIFSVVGFGAGYALGKEAGRQEALTGLSGQNLSDSTACGKEVVRGSGSSLKRIPWRAGVSKAIAAQ